MSYRELLEADCGGPNALMRLGNQMTRDTALKDEGLSGAFRSLHLEGRQRFEEGQLVNEFLQQVATPVPQTFRVDDLLQEMREIEGHNYQNVTTAPPVIDHVNHNINWANEYLEKKNELFEENKSENYLHALNDSWLNTQNLEINKEPEQHLGSPSWAENFFESIDSKNNFHKDDNKICNINNNDSEKFHYSEFMDFMQKVNNNQLSDNWADEFDGAASLNSINNKEIKEDNWEQEFENNKKIADVTTDQYNQQFWNRLQDEWKKVAGESSSGEHPWLSEYSDYYDPYKEYEFNEDNPMENINNALEKGKVFLVQGDIPSAVLCFESSAKQFPDNYETWQLLGISQAENEKDPQAIAALKKSLLLKQDNMDVLMALAISYTNEGFQSHALKMLIHWLHNNEKYKDLIPSNILETLDNYGEMASSLIGAPQLKEVQDLFLKAVQINPTVIDADIQEALGVLFNLSSEYEKAADCYRAALQVNPNNPKTWNRLGASLANGNFSVESVEAYHRALDLQPGYIRARYNVGIICINLKAYREAVEHFLTALNHQVTSNSRSGIQQNDAANNMSDTIWSTLRMAISLLGKHDLQTAIDNKDLNALNAVFGTND